jgi:hypothetical protein
VAENPDDVEYLIEELKLIGQSPSKDHIFVGITDEKCKRIEPFNVDDQHQEDQVHLSEGSTCVNAVLEVNYNIYWRAGGSAENNAENAVAEITKIQANVLLGNLTLKRDKKSSPKNQEIIPPSSGYFQEVHQIYSVTFIHNFPQSAQWVKSSLKSPKIKSKMFQFFFLQNSN